MNCLAQRKRFKNKHPVWSDPSEGSVVEPTKIDDEDQVSGSDHDYSSEDDDKELVTGEVRSKRIRLETKELIFKHLTNINNERSYNGSIKQVQFHPMSKMAMVALARGQIDLFEIDGERNLYLQNIKLPHTKKPFCLFKPDGNSVVISSDNYRGHFFTYDLVSSTTQKYALRVGREVKDITDFTIYGDYMACRKEGSQDIFVLSSKTYENAFSLKLNEPAQAIQFTGNNDVFIAGQNAKVYIWDLRKTSLCKHRFQDDGSVHATSLAISESSQSLSIGSDCGIVNSYQLDKCLTDKFPIPTKTFSNLKKPIDILNYNHSGELLLMGSKSEPQCFRMIHTYSETVYKNFPVQEKHYGHLLSAHFSPLSGYLALGCSTGRAHLCRIPYYKSY